MAQKRQTFGSIGASGKEALKKAIILSIPLFILNFIIVSHVINDIGLPYFLSHFKIAFYMLFNTAADVITFYIVLMQFHKIEHHKLQLG
ncbi:hypothetical protein [Hydrogenovibrio marinus]|uniref:Uncharacterized protein n=1 Tax=Hydrogenovibrio marinus TaxID=28885 RepID=A0A066ZYX1_HYDMR|nr:hypothetical protein [Hydrogenovibrio marinus]KDN95295.1 hypothetical protein EI16_03055 [Hydrogenovibrio marinus]BBN59777.1 hypothetical protein HVMH_1371 [Hydrogenovibrio marinus]